MLLDGIHVPLTTPFYPDGRLNLRKLEHNVDRYSKGPIAGMLSTSWLGEGNALSDEETREAWKAAIGAAADEKVMLAAVLRDGVLPALELVDVAAKLGFDAVVLAVPGRLEGRMRETMMYFQAIADRAALPVVVTSDRMRPLEVEAIGELAGHARIIGVIEGSGREGMVAAIREKTARAKREATVTTVFAAVTGRMLARAKAPIAGGASLIGIEGLQGGGTAIAAPLTSSVSGPTLKTRTRETGFQVLGGLTANILADLRAGAVGAIPAMAACAPQACFEVLAGWKDGDGGLAEEKQARLVRAAGRIEGEMGLAGMKYACDLNGYYGGRPRLPYGMASGVERMEVDLLMAGMRN